MSNTNVLLNPTPDFTTQLLELAAKFVQLLNPNQDDSSVNEWFGQIIQITNRMTQVSDRDFYHLNRRLEKIIENNWEHFNQNQKDQIFNQLAVAVQFFIRHQLKISKQVILSTLIALSDQEGLFTLTKHDTQDFKHHFILWICENIHRYDPNRNRSSYRQWFLCNLKFRKRDWKRKQNKEQYNLSLDNPIKLEKEGLVSYLDLLPSDNQLCSSKNFYEDWEKLKLFIVQDPDKKFSAAHPKNAPDKNFRDISLMRFEGMTWKQIGQLFNTTCYVIQNAYERLIDNERHQLKQYIASYMEDYWELKE